MQVNKDATKANEKAAKAQMEIGNLKDVLSQREAAIRQEVAEEMEAQINSMRDHYNGVISRLKKQVGQTPGKSARKVRLDRAEAIVEELMDQIEECEEDMVRTRQIQEEQIEHLSKIHEDAMAKKESESSALRSYHEQALTMKEDEILALREQVQKLISENNEIKLDKDDIITAHEEELDVGEPRNSVLGPSAAFDENRSPIRRLRRERTSEVACSNVIPTPPKSSSKNSARKKAANLFLLSSGEKQKRKLRKRNPLSQVSQGKDNVDTSVVESEISHQESSGSEYSDTDS